jgi:hypothetical protein
LLGCQGAQRQAEGGLLGMLLLACRLTAVCMCFLVCGRAASAWALPVEARGPRRLGGSGDARRAALAERRAAGGGGRGGGGHGAAATLSNRAMSRRGGGRGAGGMRIERMGAGGTASGGRGGRPSRACGTASATRRLGGVLSHEVPNPHKFGELLDWEVGRAQRGCAAVAAGLEPYMWGD